jgi:hypothetical protein
LYLLTPMPFFRPLHLAEEGGGVCPNDSAMHAKIVEDKPPPFTRTWYQSNHRSMVYLWRGAVNPGNNN